jgi:hypothetical protein
MPDEVPRFENQGTPVSERSRSAARPKICVQALHLARRICLFMRYSWQLVH